MALLAQSASCYAEKVSAFQLTELDSYLALRYLLDEQVISTGGVDTLQDRRPTFQEEYAIATQSYIYHPNFLNMDIGGSLLLDQSRFESLNTENQSHSELLNFNTRLNFLAKKPYPFSLYYDKQNPSVSTGLGGRFIQENIKYGVDFSLQEPFSPIQLTINSFQLTSKGEGFDQIVNDVQQQTTVRMYHAYGSGDHFQVSLLSNDLQSQSGNPDLPIIARKTSTDSVNIDSRNLFGKLDQLQLTNVMSYSEQHEYPVRRDVRIAPNIRWIHSDSLSSFYRLNLSDSTEEDIENNNKKMVLGLSYFKAHINGSFDVHGESSKATGISFDNIGSNYSLALDRDTSAGNISVSYSGNLDVRNQQSDIALFEVFSEPLSLQNIDFVTLNHDFIDTTTLVVSNVGRTQVYIENQDYRVVVIGTKTQIQRLAGGSIISGQPLVVDYSYQTGGTFEYANLNNNLQLEWSISDFYNLYIRYKNNRQKLRQGAPSIPLNSVDSTTSGIRIDRPLLSGINLGGEAYVENHQEDINPYVRKNLDAYIEMPLPSLTNLRFSGRRVRVDNKNSVEDVDLTGYIMRIQSRPWLRVNMSLESSYEEDTGGTINRLIRSHRLKFDWRYRQLSFAALANYSTEEQGVIRRDRWAIKLLLRRDF